jgi:hypothetical protein
MKNIGVHVGYTALWGKVSKVVGAGIQMCYYPVALPIHVMAVVSETRVVRVLCLWVATPCSVSACVCVWVATECARVRLIAHGSASTKRFLFLMMPKRRGTAKSVSAFISDLNMR